MGVLVVKTPVILVHSPYYDGMLLGDDAIPTPYAYVGPHDPLTDNPFWNAPFGAYRTWHKVTTAEQAVAFFRVAQEALANAVKHGSRGPASRCGSSRCRRRGSDRRRPP